MLLAIIQALLIFWPAWIVLVIWWAIKIALKLYETNRLSKAGIAKIDEMNGKDFEKYLAILFKKLGYKVKRTPYQGDYGADLVIQKDGKQIVVQAKRYKRNVGLKAVQEAAAAKDYYKCDRAMVVTNSGYSKQAKKLAAANKVELWGRKKLVDNILSVK